MRQFIVILCIVLTLAACKPSDPVLHDHLGRDVQLSQLKGKWVVVNVWASWCESCIREISEFNRFEKEIQGKNIALYGLNFDQQSGPDLLISIAKMHMQYPVIVEDANDAWQMGKVVVLPTTFVLDPQGKMVKMIVGATTAKQLMKVISELQATTRT